VEKKMEILNRLFGPIAWHIGLYGVEHGYIGQSRFFTACLSYGGRWAFSAPTAKGEPDAQP
jgi:hypothetical protein